jgi:hypothetical protein
MNTTINSYNGTGTTLGGYIDGILQRNGQTGDVPAAPHRSFWAALNYKDFTTGAVPHVGGPGSPYPILVVRNGAGSNLVQALQGVGLFGPNGNMRQMPADGPHISPTIKSSRSSTGSMRGARTRVEANPSASPRTRDPGAGPSAPHGRHDLSG